MTIESPGLSEAQQTCLAQGPFDIFTLVAAADEVPDSREWAVFREAVRSGASHEDPIVRSAMSDAAMKLENRPTGPGDAAAALQALRAIRDLSASLPGAALSYRMTLVEMGKLIAEASGAQPTQSFVIGGGDGKWHTSPGTSALERESISKAAEALGLG